MLVAGAAAAIALVAGAGGGWAAATALGRRGSRARVANEIPAARSEGGELRDMTSTAASAHADGRAAPPGPQISLRLDLPEVDPDLLPVWGVGDPLPIRVSASSAAGEALADVTVRLDTGPGNSTVSKTDSSGVATVERTFTQLVAVELSCRLDGPGHQASTPPLQLRVVDYRQEVVALYNDLMDRHRNGARLGPGVTPRDAEMLLVSKALIPDQTALDVLISAFEEADYSEHRISRVHYVRAYRAWRRLTQAREAAPVTVAPTT